MNVEVPGVETFLPPQGAGFTTGDDDQPLPKRPRQDNVGTQRGADGSGQGKAPTAGTLLRRSSFKPKSSSPYDRGPTAPKNP